MRSPGSLLTWHSGKIQKRRLPFGKREASLVIQQRANLLLVFKIRPKRLFATFSNRTVGWLMAWTSQRFFFGTGITSWTFLITTRMEFSWRRESLRSWGFSMCCSWLLNIATYREMFSLNLSWMKFMLLSYNSLWTNN